LREQKVEIECNADRREIKDLHKDRRCNREMRAAKESCINPLTPELNTSA
jgi:hypothetical protein